MRFSPDCSGYPAWLGELQWLGLGWRAEQATHQTLANASPRPADMSKKQDWLLIIL
ncbi:hypothetical protein [Psychrobacter fulvigenes]|uniref:hypothetical protein n=1 Tax=Psychrobacter fulvigenes TaxID=533323 RepID=UPI001918C4E7|nr:hypothetical protein [Psychrobacter fulvigenes]